MRSGKYPSGKFAHLSDYYWKLHCPEQRLSHMMKRITDADRHGYLCKGAGRPDWAGARIETQVAKIHERERANAQQRQQISRHRDGTSRARSPLPSNCEADRAQIHAASSIIDVSSRARQVVRPSPPCTTYVLRFLSLPAPALDEPEAAPARIREPVAGTHPRRPQLLTLMQAVAICRSLCPSTAGRQSLKPPWPTRRAESSCFRPSRP